MTVRRAPKNTWWGTGDTESRGWGESEAEEEEEGRGGEGTGRACAAATAGGHGWHAQCSAGDADSMSGGGEGGGGGGGGGEEDGAEIAGRVSPQQRQSLAAATAGHTATAPAPPPPPPPLYTTPDALPVPCCALSPGSASNSNSALRAVQWPPWPALALARPLADPDLVEHRSRCMRIYWHESAPASAVPPPPNPPTPQPPTPPPSTALQASCVGPSTTGTGAHSPPGHASSRSPAQIQAAIPGASSILSARPRCYAMPVEHIPAPARACPPQSNGKKIK
ncbi:hypothetical protein BDZ91DRAFT_784903 [Kalaharituber pfeilii]|nr:hypothetical protein BDZ91DRAFT_784903 [Kalaharituber pfeilii]